MRGLITVLIIIFCLLVLFIGFNPHRIEFLHLYRGDDFAMMRTLDNIYSGLVTLDVKRMFSFFPGYGTIFYYYNLLFAMPFIATGLYDSAIVATRLATNMFFLASLFLVYVTFSTSKGITTCLLLVLTLCSMPEFLANTNIVYPVWMSNAFLLLSIYFLHRDSFQLQKNFYFAVISFSICVSAKLQYIMCAPLIFNYILFKYSRDQFKMIKISTSVSLLIIGSYIVTNPYLMHPLGINFWIKGLSVAKDWVGKTDGDIIYKLNSLSDSFYNKYIILMLFILYGVALLFQHFNAKVLKDSDRFLTVIGLTGLVGFTFLLVFVSGNFDHYFPPVMIMLTIYAFFKFESLFKEMFGPTVSAMVIIACFFANIYFSKDRFYKIVNRGFGQTSEVAYGMEEMSFIKSTLWKAGYKRGHQILASPYTFIPINELGIKLNQIHTIYGPLKESTVSMRSFISESASKDRGRFVPKNFVIIRKSDTSNYAATKRGNVPRSLEKRRVAARKIINDMKNGYLGYKLIDQDAKILIFKLASDPEKNLGNSKINTIEIAG